MGATKAKSKGRRPALVLVTADGTASSASRSTSDRSDSTQQKKQSPILHNKGKEKIKKPIIRMRKPRGPATPYGCFMKACRDRRVKLMHNEEDSDDEDEAKSAKSKKRKKFNLSEFSKACSSKWSKFTDEEKVPYKIMSRKDSIRHRQEMSIYVPPPPRKVRKHRVKDPNAPHRNLSAYLWFCTDERIAIKALNPTYKIGDIAKELGRNWRQIDPQTKRKYEKLAERDKARYKKEIAVYKEMLMRAKERGEYEAFDELFSEQDE